MQTIMNISLRLKDKRTITFKEISQRDAFNLDKKGEENS